MSADSFSTQPQTRKPRCPSCDAEQFSARPVKCWLCELPLASGAVAEAQTDDSSEPADRIALPKRRGDNPAWIVFGVLALLIGLGLGSAGPGILIVLLVLAVPALIRAALAAFRQSAGGRPLSGLGFASTFLSSVGIVAMIGLASFAAFYATCWAVCGLGAQTMGAQVLTYSIAVGVVVGLVVAVLLFRRLWPLKD
jgi:hypothetical protein